MPMAPEPTISSDLGKLCRHHRLLVGPDQPAVGLEPRQRARPRAGGDDDVLGLDIGQRLAALARHGDAPLPSQPRRAVDHLDLVLAHQIGDAVRQPLGHFAAALDHARKIEADIVGGEPELGGAPHRCVKLGGAQQRLGRDAAPVEADAAEMLALDDRDLHAELGRGWRRHSRRAQRRPDRMCVYGGHYATAPSCLTIQSSIAAQVANFLYSINVTRQIDGAAPPSAAYLIVGYIVPSPGCCLQSYTSMVTGSSI